MSFIGKAICLISAIGGAAYMMAKKPKRRSGVLLVENYTPKETRQKGRYVKPSITILPSRKGYFSFGYRNRK